jgi:preprotein translocase subunit SecB
MSNIQEASIQFLNFVIRESHIVYRQEGQYKINIDFDPKGHILTNLNQFHLELGVKIVDEEEKFEINLHTISVFTYPEDADLEEYKNGLFIQNAPAIIFPYLRAYVSTLTALSGMPTLTLPTLNIMAIGDILRKNIVIVEE